MKVIFCLLFLLFFFSLNATKPSNSRDYFNFIDKIERLKQLKAQQGNQAALEYSSSLEAKINFNSAINNEERLMFVEEIKRLKHSQ